MSNRQGNCTSEVSVILPIATVAVGTVIICD